MRGGEEERRRGGEEERRRGGEEERRRGGEEVQGEWLLFTYLVRVTEEVINEML